MSSTSTTRACESCRAQKVRCQPAPASTAGSQGECQRCAAAGKACVYTPARRTKRKRTDVRVRELEQELRTLSESLRSGRPDAVPAPSRQSEPRGERGAGRSNAPLLSSGLSPSVPSWLGSASSSPRMLDPVDAGILPMDYATRLFDRYVSDLAPLRPLVVFPPGTPAAEVRLAKPSLFLAVLVAAASTLDIELCTRLNEALLQVYAERIVIRGEKSLELIQAILVSTNWYCHRRGDLDHMKFYQQLHMAGTMAVDIDLAEMTGMLGDGMDGVAEQVLAIECGRTLLGCYICCSSLSLNFHRPNMFPFTPQIEECFTTLETSPFALPSDATLAAWARLQRVIDISESALDLRGPGFKVNLSDGGVQLSLLNCTKQLEEWKERMSGSVINEPLLMQYYAVMAILHQKSLYIDYSATDFKPPYTISLPSPNSTSKLLTPAHLNSLTKCLSATRSLIDVFLLIPTPTIVCSPVVVFARLGHALHLLVKIHASALCPWGVLNGVLDVGETNVQSYLEAVESGLEDVCKGEEHCRLVELAWMLVVRGLVGWCRENFRKTTEELKNVRPLTLLGLMSEAKMSNWSDGSGKAPGKGLEGQDDTRVGGWDVAITDGGGGVSEEGRVPLDTLLLPDFEADAEEPGYGLFSEMVTADLNEWMAGSAEF